MGKQTLTKGLLALEKQGKTRPKPEEKETQAVQNMGLSLPWFQENCRVQKILAHILKGEPMVCEERVLYLFL